MSAMAEKEIETKVSKLKRKFSRKAASKASSAAPSPVTASPVSVRSATLPISCDPKSLALHESHSEGLFSKLRRRFRFGSKGKYDLKLYTENSPSKPRWLRRKSEETQGPDDDDNLSLDVDPKVSVGKSNSVKTQRKSKSDKEEVILIRKDKRVSVICKTENGESEVIFSNAENVDENMSETTSEMDEDPYATISSVKEQIAKKNKNTKVVNRQNGVQMSCAATANNNKVDTEQSNKFAVDIDEYPYAKIDTSKKKPIAVSHPSLEARSLPKQTCARVRSQIEPDYETLDEIKQKKNEFRSQGNMHSSYLEAVMSDPNITHSSGGTGVLDPDYECLDDVKQRCVSSNMSAHSGSGSFNPVAITCINNTYQPSSVDKAMLDNSGVRSPHSHDGSEASSSRLSPALGASPDSDIFLRRLSAASSQDSRPASMSSPRLTGRTSSSLSPSAVAPLAPSIDSSLPNDAPLHQQASPLEECLYDNPNIILRKQVTRSITNASTLGRRGNTHSEPPIIKTPAEEELVEKLSALLAPPLPLRNYQKDEVHPRSGTASARHSWSSQGSRSTETGEFAHSRDIERSPITSLNHSRENLIIKSVKDSLMNQVYERHDFYSRSNGADLLRKKETSSLEKYLRKTSPQAIKSNKLLDKSNEGSNSDYSTVNKSHSYETNSLPCRSHQRLKEIKHQQTQNIDSTTTQSQLADSSGIVRFCHDLVKNIIDEACQQFSICDTSFSRHSKSHIQNGIERPASEELNSLSACSETERARSGTTEAEVSERLASTEIGVHGHTDLRSERCAKFVSADICHIKECPEITFLGKSEISSGQIQDKLKEGINAMKVQERNMNMANGSIEDKTVGSEDVTKNVLYNLQGARPKVRPLMLGPVSSLPAVHGCLDNTKAKPKHSMNGTGESKSEVENNCSKQFSQDSPTWDETLSPMFSDMDFRDSIEEDISQHRKSNTPVRGESMKKSQDEYNDRYFENSDPSIQETVYVDSDNEFGLDINKKVTVNVRRNQCISRVAKPVVYANPRLLENVISGAFKKTVSLDTAYLVHGVFRWGRYFPALGENRQAVESKLKAFFNFVLEMLLSPSRLHRNQYRVKKLQEEVDRIQLKIERRLKCVQDLPTFQDIRLQLLKTESVDDWEPEKPVASYFDNSEGHQDAGRINNERAGDRNLHDFTNVLIKREPAIKRDYSPLPPDNKQSYAQDFDVGNMFHSDDSFSEVDEVFCVFDNGQSVMNLPNSPTEVLDEFVQLSRSRLKCKYCYTVEESDSEDEMVAVETYAKTVSTSVCPQLSNRIDYVAAGSLCRAFYGELAYTSYMRKHRNPTKLLIVPGPGIECGGSESHLSWNNWCCIDALFTKLIPHISPRLDFQYLLRTYDEFKHFVLIDRERNLEHKGCFVKRSPRHILKCCRFQEFVFLKIIRDEIRHFSHIFSMSRASRDLFLEERDVGFSLLSLLRIVLRNIHKMRRSLSKEEVGTVEPKASLTNKGNRICFRHSAFQKWSSQEEYFTDPVVSSDQQRFHIRNFENFRFGSLSQTLRNWKSPQAYVHDPNVLASCRTLFAQPDTKGVEEPKPLHEQQDFLESMEQLQLKDWYWGPISYEQATLILKDKEDGSFLVRDSSDQKYLLSLSFKSLGEVHHTRIEHAKGLFSFWSQPESHGKARICEFIEKSIQNSRDGRFLYFLRPSARGMPPLPIRLLTPVSRNFRVATLKHLSRFVVRQTVRKDHLDLLPVPEKVKRYLRDKQYYVEILDDDQWAFDGDYGKSSK